MMDTCPKCHRTGKPSKRKTNLKTGHIGLLRADAIYAYDYVMEISFDYDS